MSGKSTFLRTIGVNVVLAQTVNTCLATEYSAPVFTVRSVIGSGDDLVSGKSYYKDEVEAVLALVHLSRSRLPHLFLFDELFRGTGTFERIAAGEAVLTELVRLDHHDRTGSPHVVIAATHDRELVDLMRDLYTPCHFSDTVGSDGLSFDYLVRAGPAVSRNAIALLEKYGAPRRIVQGALARLADLDS
jgi:DNA mismatch repair ATPase MutS